MKEEEDKEEEGTKRRSHEKGSLLGRVGSRSGAFRGLFWSSWGRLGACWGPAGRLGGRLGSLLGCLRR
eukprot:4837468-Pyramimonas_sp.AAC.1